jgi:hypothetical protein
MTEAAAPRERKPRESRRDTLWVTDEELIERSGVPANIMRQALIRLDNDRLSGFPKKQALYGQRRYWPAVQEYWAATNPVPKPRVSPQEERRSA